MLLLIIMKQLYITVHPTDQTPALFWTTYIHSGTTFGRIHERGGRRHRQTDTVRRLRLRLHGIARRQKPISASCRHGNVAIAMALG